MKLELIAKDVWTIYQVIEHDNELSEIFEKHSDKKNEQGILEKLYLIAKSKQGSRVFNTRVAKTVNSEHGIIQIRQTRYRLLCFEEDDNKLFICGISFIKKNTKQQNKMINKAVKLKIEYLEAKQNSSLTKID